MWLRKKLKRGQASLLTLKNRLTDKLIACLVFLSVLTGIIYYSEKIIVSAGVFFTPTDTFLSLGQFYEDLSKKEDVTYILYHIDGGSNSLYNPKYISRNEMSVSLRIPHKFGYDFEPVRDHTFRWLFLGGILTLNLDIKWTRLIM